MGKRGPKLKEINWDQVEKLCAIQCTFSEIAATCNVDEETLNKRCIKDHKVKFSEYYEQKRQHGFSSLRSRQYRLAIEGNPTMLVWLGKNWLSQTDKLETNNKTELTANVAQLTIEEITNLLKKS